MRPDKQYAQSARDYNFRCSILGPILFKLSVNDFFLFMALASFYNFADDNTLSAFATTVSRLIKILESESEIVVKEK